MASSSKEITQWLVAWSNGDSAALDQSHWPMHARERDIAKYKGKYDQGYESFRRAGAAKRPSSSA